MGKQLDRLVGLEEPTHCWRLRSKSIDANWLRKRNTFDYFDRPHFQCCTRRRQRPVVFFFILRIEQKKE